MTSEQIQERLGASAGDKPLRIHLIGVAGSGMSGLAALCLALGHRVSGSDRVMSAETKALEKAGLRFSCPHTSDAVQGADVVIYSSAVKEGNKAYDAAVAAGITLLRRAEALALLMKSKKGIVIAGTHGKTTTSALLSHVLRVGGFHPSHYVGAEIPILGSNAYWDSEGEYFVAEGDESDGTLVNFHPTHSVVLNLEEEHLDFYDGIDSIRKVFARLLEQTSGLVMYCAEDPHASEVCSEHSGARSYGWSRNHDYSAGVLASDGQSTEFSVFRRGELLGRLELNIPGRHNVLNALAVIGLSLELGVEFSFIQQALLSFRGARRRFDRKYVSENYLIVDDYGHHPTEVAATLETARSQGRDRVVVLFQPHRYSRTRHFAEHFGKVFAAADVVYVTDVYAASEAPIPGVSGRTIVEAISALSPEIEVTFLPRNSEAHWKVGAGLEKGDLLLTLGAGDVHLVGEQLKRDLQVLEALEEGMKGEHGVSRLYEPMSKHTTMRVGGPAQYWVEPHSFAALAAVVQYGRRNQLPVFVVGRGSNLLVRDGGISGIVVHPAKGEFSRVQVNGSTIEAGVGAKLKAISGAARAAGLGGFEWMEGIPGNVGGGLRMNAGAMGSATFDQVVSVRYLDVETGAICDKAKDDFEYRYRNVPELERNIALSAVFEGSKTDISAIDLLMDESKDKRRRSQPVGASAGCIFKNPESTSAGKLVDELGLKGHRVGKARVSEVHGNFIVNDGGATADEVLKLIAEIQETAMNTRGIEIHTEVQIVGQDRPNTFSNFVR